MGITENLVPTVSEASQISALLDRGCEFEGKMTFEGTVRINGVFSGEIFSNDTLIVGDTAVLNAEVDVDAIIISGEVNGNITARSRIEIKRPGVVRGSINTPCLVIEEGVIFEGSCKMPAPTTKTKKESSQTSAKISKIPAETNPKEAAHA